MKIGDLVHWNSHYGCIYKIINEKSGMFQIENYVANFYNSLYWVYPKNLSHITDDEMAGLIKRMLLK